MKNLPNTAHNRIRLEPSEAEASRLGCLPLAVSGRTKPVHIFTFWMIEKEKIKYNIKQGNFSTNGLKRFRGLMIYTDVCPIFS